ncbi:hypothetical protein GGP41_002863 [Bipolaris sorokiniana]|uniref:Uncharacterized protein n=1 Tax=Cochliobolus sativus TaxID=45130 RepID=A0A8H5ZBQ4_COCSA|nr:hypothetical protein GGP41_002863 [Bipolaris sorokiniana]
MPSKGHKTTKGQEYFASRFYSETYRDAFIEYGVIEILVNFAGSYQQLENDGDLFRLAHPPSNEEGTETVAKSSPRLALIELEIAHYVPQQTHASSRPFEHMASTVPRNYTRCSNDLELRLS